MEHCENCGREIGALESSCRHLGHIVCEDCSRRLSVSVPVIVTTSGRRNPRRVQTIERTGKIWKLQMLVSAACVIFGGLGLMGLQQYPEDVDAKRLALSFVVGGIAWFVFARIGAWWNHG